MTACAPYSASLTVSLWMVVMLQLRKASGNVAGNNDDVRRIRDVRSVTTCSKFTGSYAPVYYCWLEDPCVEDLLEAPRFLYSEACTTDCEALPSEYEACSDWRLDDGMQSCEAYGPLACCKYKTCLEGQECIDLVPGAAYCRAAQPPPPPPPPPITPTPITLELNTTTSPPPPPTLSTPMPTAVTTEPNETTTPISPTPRETDLPPPISIPTSPAVNTTTSVSVPSSPTEATPSSSANATATPSFSSDSAIPSAVPITTSPQPPSSPSLPVPTAVSQPSPPSPQVPSTTNEQAPQPVSTSSTATVSSGEMHPSWMTAGIIVAVAAVIVIGIAAFLDRRADADDASKRDDEMAIDEGYWNALSQKSQHGGPIFQPYPVPRRGYGYPSQAQ